MKKDNQRKIKPLSNKQLLQLKGGYRETPGTIENASTFRWDEVILRFDEEGNGSRTTTPGISKPSPDRFSKK